MSDRHSLAVEVAIATQSYAIPESALMAGVTINIWVIGQHILIHVGTSSTIIAVGATDRRSILQYNFAYVS